MNTKDDASLALSTHPTGVDNIESFDENGLRHGEQNSVKMIGLIHDGYKIKMNYEFTSANYKHDGMDGAYLKYDTKGNEEIRIYRNNSFDVSETQFAESYLLRLQIGDLLKSKYLFNKRSLEQQVEDRALKMKNKYNR